MNIHGKAALVTGANRGIGRAIVLEALARGASRVYAGTRSGELDVPDERVLPIVLDVTDPAQIAAAAAQVEDLALLVNNAGVLVYDDLSSDEVIRHHLAVNLFGLLNVSRAFHPHLQSSGGSILNVLSLSGLAPVPMMPAYSLSKAAALSATQSMRLSFGRDGVSVHAGIIGPVDTDMTRGVDLPKASPEQVAAGLFEGIERGEEEIFPDVMSRQVGDGWRQGVSKGLEKEFAAYA